MIAEEESGEEKEHKEESAESEPEQKPTQEETRPKYSCKYCGASAFSDGRPFREWSDVGIHVRSECTKYDKTKKAGGLHERRLPERPGAPGAGETAAPRKVSSTEERGPSDESEVLEQFIGEYTDLTEPQQKIVLQWSKLQGFIHPTTLASILVDECGIKLSRANMIASKYAVALSKFQQEKAQRPNLFYPGLYPQQPNQPGRGIVYFSGQGGQPPLGYPPGYGQGYNPNQGQQGFQQSPEEIARRVGDEVERRFERRLDKIEDRLDQPAPQPQSDQYVEEYEPVREDGKIVRDTNGEVVLKKTVRPLSAARGGGEAEMYKFLLMLERDRKKDEPLTEEKVKNLIRDITDATKVPLTEDRIRAIVKEATADKPLTEPQVAQIVKAALEDRDKGRPQEDPRLTELANDLKASKDKLDDMGKKMDEKDKQALHDKIDGLNSQLENVRQDIRNMPTGEWKSDELKALSQGVHELKEFLDKRKPIDTLLEKGPKAIRAIQLQPPLGEEIEEPPVVETKAPPGPPEEIKIPPPQDEVTQELRKHNYTVRLK